MKNVWIALCLLWLVIACLPEKIGKKDPEPDLAGTYQITNFVNDGVTLIPRSGVSGRVNVTKDSDNQLAISFSITNNGQTSNVDGGIVSISKSSGSSYDIVESGTRIGSIDGTNFSLSYSDINSSFSISAKK
ncbi:hypothetical protein [Spirosoma endbachense]|uniref:Lipocalin-like domain-containing protein n=1 Tax=Spirosoma endbachense TaxID=2666025 RepID=A0A6P1W1V7_9BACT|nr:hypothetical protein [Spirosoma endbachense]QHV99025.1 hypothetical protein GJR95_30240 [Spirosoma endbachense]